MRFSTLADWLAWQETLHPSEIELGLDRVAAVQARLHPEPPPFTVITVAGTNGKGSSVALLEAILLAAGYRVGAYTSPHLLRYNERVRVAGQAVDDAALIAAFARIDAARGDTSLTYFEFGTLAALDIFHGQALDVILLEVGLGGRLDAVNILDPDVALITAIGIDHTRWLGEDREAIAAEKAGILRPGLPAVFSGRDLPASLAAQAARLGVSLAVAGRDYSCQAGPDGWRWQYADAAPLRLPRPALPGAHQLDNAGGVLMALHRLKERLPVSVQAMRQGLLDVVLAGRFQVIPGPVEWVLDVAHNPDSMTRLAELLAQRPPAGRTHAILGMLADKDIATALVPLVSQVDAWIVVPLDTPRSAPAADLGTVLREHQPSVQILTADGMEQAIELVRDRARPGDRVIVTGSFYTVAAALTQGI
ncbi:MAG: bifunctional tetrahydrofolate synthase/dihydrofolate synthase [Alphaproteobacteria bacterium]